VGTRLAGVGTRLAGVGTRLAGVGTRLAGVGTRLAGVGTRQYNNMYHILHIFAFTAPFESLFPFGLLLNLFPLRARVFQMNPF
jgi:hypothetical protein